MSNVIQVRDIIESKDALENARNLVVVHKEEMFEFFDEGNTRYVYANKDKTRVIKLLKSDCYGLDYNIDEYRIYINASVEDKRQMANTKLRNGFIEQEFCLPIKFAGKKLTIKQRLFAASCRNEVGWRNENELVCFDLDEYKKY